MSDAQQPAVGDKVLIGYDPFTNLPKYATIAKINDNGTWEVEYDGD